MVAVKKPARFSRLAPADRLFYALDYILLFVLAMLIMVPLLNVFVASFSAPEEVLAGRVALWPRSPTLEVYRAVLQNQTIVRGFLNTLFYAGAGTLLNLAMTVLAAYPLSKRNLRGRTFITVIFTFTMFFGGGMIPSYLLIRDLGLINTRAVMIIPGALSVWNMILCRTFFQNTIPGEMFESAALDGAGHGRTLASIVLPLSMPILAVLTLFYAVGHWNSYFNAMLYLHDVKLFNMQLVLRIAINNTITFLSSSGTMVNLEREIAYAEATKYVMIVITMVPVLIIYPFVQKYFIKGIMIGALKG